jgi:hypothetical protein
MPRRALPLAMTDDAPIRVPKKKRLAAKIVSNPTRKRTKAKTKASQRVATQPLLQLPAPRPIPHATFASPTTAAQQEGIASPAAATEVKLTEIEKQKRFEDVPMLHNLVPAQVLTGRSTFNTGTSISAGLPLYARSNIKAVAATLERK